LTGSENAIISLTLRGESEMNSHNISKDISELRSAILIGSNDIRAELAKAAGVSEAL
jgi:hypothetical protein